MILASKSPRRIEILKNNGIIFKTIPSDFDENLVLKTLNVKKYVMILSEKKAEEIAIKYPNELILACDTVVFHKRKILEKPKDGKQAFEMLSSLSGGTHKVFTGCCILYKDIKINFFDMSLVTFKQNSTEDILNYIKSGSPFDKAGGYGIQDDNCNLIDSYTGDLDNIIGLPYKKIITVLKENGLFKLLQFKKEVI